MSDNPVPISLASPSTAYYIRNVSSGTFLGVASDNSTVGLYPLGDDTRSNVKKWNVTDPQAPGSQGVAISADDRFLKVESLPGDPVVLYSLLSTTAHDTILLATNQPSDVDSLVEFYGHVASKLPSSLSHPGNQAAVKPPAEQTRPIQTYVLDAAGGDLLVEHLTCQLWNELYGPTSRIYTPDVEHDQRTGGRRYYRSAFVHSALLARAFSSQPSFRPRLWRAVEEVLVKGIFSGTQQEPGNFVVTAVLIYGAGNAIREWLKDNAGRGKEWSPWHCARTRPDDVWSWSDIVGVLQNVDALIDPEFEAGVPGEAMSLFKALKGYVGDGSAELQDWSSQRLATAYAWIDGLPERAPTPERSEPPEDVGEIVVLHPGDPGYDDEDDEDRDVMMAQMTYDFGVDYSALI